MMILNKMKTIDEDKLNRLAEIWDGWDDSSDESEWKFTKDDLVNAYKAGYRNRVVRLLLCVEIASI